MIAVRSVSAWITAVTSALLLSACDARRDPVQTIVTQPAQQPAVQPDTSGIAPGKLPVLPTHPMFLATTARRATWARMKQENHWLYQLARNNCQLTGSAGERYYDIGRWCAWIFQVDRDTVAARRAISKLMQMGASPGPGNFNWLRESFIDYAILTDWVWDAMSNAERSIALADLNGWARWALGKDGLGGFMRSSDSDQLHGSYFGIALTDLLQRNIPGAPRWLDSTMTGPGHPLMPMGGLVEGSVGGESARNVVGYFARMARGGAWNESSEYNLGTMKLIVQGVEAVRTATGRDYFPEFTSLLRDVAHYQVYSVTPDLGQAAEWGDLEHPHDFSSRMYDQVVLDGMLAGATADAGVQRLLMDLWSRWGTSGAGSAEPFVNGWRMMPLFDPYMAPGAQASGGWPAPGRGQLLVRLGSSLFFGEAQNNTGEDHSVGYVHNLSLYREGEWVLDHPRGYNGEATQALATNGTSYAGMGAAMSKGLVRIDSGSGWWSITGQTGGTSAWAGYWDPPPAFLTLGLRTMLYTKIDGADVVVTFDSVAGQPLIPTRIDRYYALSLPLMQSITALAGDGFASVWHASAPPVATTDGYSWTTPGGQAVRVSAWGTGMTTALIDERNGSAWPGGGAGLTMLGWQMRFHMTGSTLVSVAVIGRGALPAVTRTATGVQVGSATITISSTGESVSR